MDAPGGIRTHNSQQASGRKNYALGRAATGSEAV